MRELGAPMVALPGDLSSIRDRKSLEGFYRRSLVDGLNSWRDQKMNDAQALLLNSMVSRGFLPGEVAGLPGHLKTLVERYRRLEAEIRNPARVPGVMDGEPWDQPLLDRGDYKKEGEAVERGFLEVFGGRTYTKTGSGRRELAEDIVGKGNTLTTRVIVNRLWHHVFGRGLVASADNFGRLGSKPSHPGLLDYLAMDFRENGWLMKRTVRQLVMSRAFRSASTVPAANRGKDDANLQLAYYTPRRLDAEAIEELEDVLITADLGPATAARLAGASDPVRVPRAAAHRPGGSGEGSVAYACSRALRALLARDAPAEVCALADAAFEATICSSAKRVRSEFSAAACSRSVASRAHSCVLPTPASPASSVMPCESSPPPSGPSSTAQPVDSLRVCDASAWSEVAVRACTSFDVMAAAATAVAASAAELSELAATRPPRRLRSIDLSLTSSAHHGAPLPPPWRLSPVSYTHLTLPTKA